MPQTRLPMGHSFNGSLPGESFRISHSCPPMFTLVLPPIFPFPLFPHPFLPLCYKILTVIKAFSREEECLSSSRSQGSARPVETNRSVVSSCKLAKRHNVTTSLENMLFQYYVIEQKDRQKRKNSFLVLSYWFVHAEQREQTEEKKEQMTRSRVERLMNTIPRHKLEYSLIHWQWIIPHTSLPRVSHGWLRNLREIARRDMTCCKP